MLHRRPGQNNYVVSIHLSYDRDHDDHAPHARVRGGRDPHENALRVTILSVLHRHGSVHVSEHVHHDHKIILARTD
jgi:hypothetical protein